MIFVVLALTIGLAEDAAGQRDMPPSAATSFDEWFREHKTTCPQCSKGPDEPICHEAFERLKPTPSEGMRGNEVGRPFDGHIIENRKRKHPDRWDEDGKWKFPVAQRIGGKVKTFIGGSIKAGVEFIWGMLELPYAFVSSLGKFWMIVGGVCCIGPFLLCGTLVLVAFALSGRGH